MKDLKVMPGSTKAPSKLHITVTEKGPYLVYGAPPLFQQFIISDDLGQSRYYQKGKEYATDKEPTALCRCGHSKQTPYCDSSHNTAHWNPTLTAPNESMLSNANIIEGEELTLVDNERYCVFARFCHPQGGTWRLTEESRDADAHKEAVRQASLCPGGRLTAWEYNADKPHELTFDPDLGLLEDPSIGVSSGLWVRGGIEIRRENGESYEIRNRVVLCRCGSSHDKPYCDGSHARNNWHDNLEELEEKELVADPI